MILRIKHSGHLGDVIYSIPAMLGLSKRYGYDACELFIPNDKPTGLHPAMNHPGGNMMINQAMYDFIEPLLKSQACIVDVHFVSESEIQTDCVDFDIIRNAQLNLSAGNIVNYYLKAFGLFFDASHGWLDLPDEQVEDEPCNLLIGRSMRYLNDRINFDFLNEVEGRKGFIGSDYEYASFTSAFPLLRIERIPVKNALEAAQRIRRAKLYIGNQSFFFALAESLKVPRLLECFEPVPNVVPVGGVCGQFVTTRGLQFLVGDVFERQYSPYAERDGGFRLC